MTPGITNVRLYGRLGKLFGTHWRLHANTIKEVLDLIEIKHPDIRQTIVNMENVDFGIRVGRKQIGENRLTFPLNGKTLSITPVVRGAKKGWLQVVAGVVLVIVGIVVSAYGGGVIGGPMIMAGIGLIAGGIVQLLSPSPLSPTSTTAESKTRPSYLFSNIVNTVGQGECVPVFYGGPAWIGSAVVSAGFEAVNVTQGSTAGSGTSTSSGSGTAGASSSGGGSAGLPIRRNDP